MTTSAVLGIPYIAGQQNQPEVTHNEALNMFQALTGTGVISVGLNTPPGSPSEGDGYIIGASPTGAWAGEANKVAFYLSSQWVIVPGNDSNGTPITMSGDQEGLRVWDKNTDDLYIWTDQGVSPGNYEWRTRTLIATDFSGFSKQYIRNVSNAANTTSCTAATDIDLPIVGDGSNNFASPSCTTGKNEFDATFNSSNGGFIIDQVSQYTNYTMRITVENLGTNTTIRLLAFLVFDKTDPSTGVQITSENITAPASQEISTDLQFFDGGIEAVYVQINSDNTRDFQLNGVYLVGWENQEGG